MGIFKRRKKPNRYIREGPGRRPMMPRYTAPPERNTAEWMEAFGKNPRFAPVDKIAGDLSYAAGKLYRIRPDGEKEEICRHPFLNFMEYPNPLMEMTASALWKLHAEYLILKGEAYCIIERYPDKTPAELWPVPPQWVQTIPYMGFPFYTIRATDGTIMNVPVEDMFVQKDLNPRDPYSRGLGQTESVADEVEIDEYAAGFQKAFFYNGATPDTLVILPGADEKQVDRFKARWKERFTGVTRSHGVDVLGGPREGNAPSVTKLGDNMKDLDMVNGRTFIRDTVMERFGMPREIMGITQNSNRATADAAQYIYAKNVLRPRLMQRQDAINMQLLPAYGDDLVWEYDDIIPHDVEFDKSVSIEGWNNNLLTKNESRELLGFDAVEYGDIFKAGYSDVYIGMDEDPAGISSRMMDLQYPGIYGSGGEGDSVETEPDEKNDADSEIEILHKAECIRERQIKAAGRNMDIAKAAQTRKFELAAMKYLQRQEQLIQRALSGQKADGDIWDAIGMTQEEYNQLSDAEKSGIIDRFTDGLIDWEKETGTLEAVLAPLWAETYKKGAEALQKTYRLNGLNVPELANVARLRGGQRVTRVTQSTKEEISRIITAGLEEGRGNNRLADEIAAQMGTCTERARLIAEQECGTSLMAGNYDMAKKGGFRAKTWHALNNDARETHWDLNGRTVPFDAPFVTKKGNRLMMPRDPDCSAAEEVIRCRCFLTYS